MLSRLPSLLSSNPRFEDLSLQKLQEVHRALRTIEEVGFKYISSVPELAAEIGEAVCKREQEEKAKHKAWMQALPVPERYRLQGCRIPDTANRGISLGQLRDLQSLVQEVLKKTDIHNDLGERQSWDAINLYVVNAFFVKPLTDKREIAFVELVAVKEQVPRWFASHYWGTPFRQTTRMLALHARERGFDGYYWLCTFANNQHHTDELNGNLAESPFVRVLRSTTCVGTVALMDTKATPFRRAWCVLECYESTQRARVLYDVAAWVGAGARRIDGKSGPEQAALQLETGDDTGHCHAVEFPEETGWFPWSVAESGAKTNIREAMATEVADKRAIMTYLDGAEDEVNITVRQRFASSAMSRHAHYGNTSELTSLLQSCPGAIDQADVYGTTPSYMAAAKGHVETLKALVQAKADVNQGDKNGTTPSLMAAQNGHVEALRALLLAKADVHQGRNDGAMPSHVAAENGYVEALQALVQAKADMRKRTKDGFTPSYAAAQNGHAEALKALVLAKADVDQGRIDGATPSLIAAQNGQVEALKFLVLAKADVNRGRNDGTTPSCIAAYTGHVEAMKVLVAAKADVHTRDHGGTTLSYVAAENGHVGTLKALMLAKVDVNKGDNNGFTPAHVAAYKGHLETLRALVEARADVNRANRDGTTPADLAAREKHVYVADLLWRESGRR